MSPTKCGFSDVLHVAGFDVNDSQANSRQRLRDKPSGGPVASYQTTAV
jgi:hypothetical protein